MCRPRRQARSGPPGGLGDRQPSAARYRCTPAVRPRHAAGGELERQRCPMTPWYHMLYLSVLGMRPSSVPREVVRGRAVGRAILRRRPRVRLQRDIGDLLQAVQSVGVYGGLCWLVEFGSRFLVSVCGWHGCPNFSDMTCCHES